VIPLKNGARFIGEALDSIAAQTMPASDVIVVDDGSDDTGVELARSHSIGARVVQQRPAGEAAARNWGLALSTTDEITFLDQDDLWHPEHLERATDVRQHSDSACVAPTLLHFVTTSDGQLEDSSRVVAPEAQTLEWLCNNHAPVGAPRFEEVRWERAVAGGVSNTVLARREILIRAGGFPIACPGLGDYLLLANLTRLGTVVRLTPPSTYGRVHQNNAGSMYDMSRRTLAVRNMLREAFGDTSIGIAWDAYSIAGVIHRGTGGSTRSVLDALAYAELLRPPKALTTETMTRALASRALRWLGLRE
jgi:glycosyltransferase involved in cell wall biosynthesis